MTLSLGLQYLVSVIEQTEAGFIQSYIKMKSAASAEDPFEHGTFGLSRFIKSSVIFLSKNQVVLK